MRHRYFAISAVADQLVGGMAVTLGARVAGLVLQTLVFVLMARRFGISLVGMYSIVSAVWALARFLGPLGYDQLIMRYASPDRSDGKAIVLHAMKWVLTYSIAGGVVLAGSCVALAWLKLINIDVAILAATVAAFPAYALTGLLVAYLRAIRENWRAQVPESILLQMLFAGGIGFEYLRQYPSLHENSLYTGNGSLRCAGPIWDNGTPGLAETTFPYEARHRYATVN